jgi:hypothetical protein
MLTTIDNPYDPFKEFTLWLMFDKEQGYNTCEYLGRIVEFSEDMTEKEKDEEIDRAMDYIIDNDFLNIYKKIWENKAP